MLKILIIDDDVSYLKLAEFVLRNNFKNCSVSLSENGLKALSKVDNDFFDVILCDYDLPIVNGTEVIQELKQKNKNLKIIANSSSSLNNLKLSAAGADDHFLKNELVSKTSLLMEKINGLLASAL